MALIKSFADIDLNNHKLKNGGFEILTTLPTTYSQSKLIYLNSTDDKLDGYYYCDGSAYIKLQGVNIKTVTSGSSMSTTNVEIGELFYLTNDFVDGTNKSYKKGYYYFDGTNYIRFSAGNDIEFKYYASDGVTTTTKANAVSETIAIGDDESYHIFPIIDVGSTTINPKYLPSYVDDILMLHKTATIPTTNLIIGDLYCTGYTISADSSHITGITGLCIARSTTTTDTYTLSKGVIYVIEDLDNTSSTDNVEDFGEYRYATTDSLFRINNPKQECKIIKSTIFAVGGTPTGTYDVAETLSNGEYKATITISGYKIAGSVFVFDVNNTLVLTQVVVTDSATNTTITITANDDLADCYVKCTVTNFLG